jgi:hypothetical protein
MSEDPITKSRATVITLSIIAVPVLYLLIFPWVVIFRLKHGDNLGVAYRPYGVPWMWLSEKTPLGEPLEAYQSFCENITGDTWHFRLRLEDRRTK